MANLIEVLRRIEELPPEKQQKVADFVDSLSEDGETGPASPPKSFTEGPFFGMWADRPEMEDSARWVTELREREWSRYRPDSNE